MRGVELCTSTPGRQSRTVEAGVPKIATPRHGSPCQRHIPALPCIVPSLPGGQGPAYPTYQILIHPVSMTPASAGKRHRQHLSRPLGSFGALPHGPLLAALLSRSLQHIYLYHCVLYFVAICRCSTQPRVPRPSPPRHYAAPSGSGCLGWSRLRRHATRCPNHDAR